MHHTRRITALFLLVALLAPTTRADDQAANPPKLDLRIAKSGWGDVRTTTVERHLQSVARELLPHFAGKQLPPINVEPKGGPIVLFKRANDGAIRMKLNTGGTLWAQYAFQFGHELCHVLCNYDADPHGNDWFEESLCEVASLYVLRRMGQTWKTDPPFDHWKSYAKHLTSYAADRLKVTHLPEGQTLAQWYKANRSKLHKSATKRHLNRIIASALLPLFEAQPRHWEAVWSLNAAKPKKAQTFERFLADWRKNTPAKHHKFIDRIAKEFGVTIAGDTP